MKIHARSKTRSRLVFSISIAMLLASAAGCGSDPLAQTGELDTTDTQRLDPDDYDGVSPLRARTQGFQLSVQPAADAQVTDFGPIWALSFESNQPLSAALSFGSGGDLGQVIARDDYRFQVRLEAAELEYLLQGAPMYLLLLTDHGDRREYAGMVQLAPRFVEASGSMLIWLEPALQLVGQDRSPWLRAQVQAASRIEDLRVVAAAEPERITRPGAGQWRFDWSVAGLLPLLGPGSEPIKLIGQDSTGEVHKLQASLSAVVAQVGLTTGDPEQVWPTVR